MGDETRSADLWSAGQATKKRLWPRMNTNKHEYWNDGGPETAGKRGGLAPQDQPTTVSSRFGVRGGALMV